MIVTLAELDSLGKRAMAGRGAPPGIDEDAAFATVWLESRGLPGLGALVAQLDKFPIQVKAPEIKGTKLDALGQSAVLLAGAIIDQTVIAGSEAQLMVTNLVDPVFLLPLADKRHRSGWSFEIAWPGAEARIDTDGTVALVGDLSGMNDVPVHVSISCQQRPLDAMSAPSDLDQHRREILATGLDIDDALRQRLSAHAATSLVPATEESRRRGAGAEASDNA